MAMQEPPAALLPRYTLDGRVPIERFFIDETSAVRGSVHFDRAELDECVSHAKTRLRSPMPSRRAGGVDHTLVARALSAGGAASVANAHVAVFGATEPWVECMCVAAGAASVTTIEYQELIYEHPRLSTIRVHDFEAAVYGSGRLAGTFDVAIALSAFDHDGLGRYGERLHPDGDLLAMRTVWRGLRPHTGRLLLSAPVGADLLVWNLHRRYGPLRLPRLLAGWREEARYGFDASRLDHAGDHRRRYEPLFVLRRNATDDLAVDAADVTQEAVAASESGQEAAGECEASGGAEAA